MARARLVTVDDHLCWVESSLKLMPGVDLPIRATALRDTDGSVTLISPVADTAAWWPQLTAWGPVRRVVAPNGFHHLHLLPALAALPEAELWASAPLRTKRSDLPTATHWLEGPGPIALTPELTGYFVNGMPDFQEWVWLHAPSRTLVVTDLVFHILQPGFALGLVTRMTGTYRKLAVSRLFVKARKDREAFRASLDLIAGLPFDRLVMAHGEPVLSGAQPLLAQALAAAP